jgi:ribosomal-protein-alanine N-acetyltransferase
VNVRRLVLRRLGALDLDLASRLHGEAFAVLGERAWTRQDMAELLASPGVAGWIAQTDETAIGVALCRVAADEAELLTIAVLPDHRRLGAGRSMLEAAIAHARAAGARSLFLRSPPITAAAWRFTVKRPLARSAAQGLLSPRRGPAADAVVMRLTLTYGG